jgi:hypothetical protein
MSLYTVRKLRTGELYGKNLTVIEAALVILNHAVARYDIRRGEEGFYWLWIEAHDGRMEIKYYQGRPVGARAETRQHAWLSIAPQIVQIEWPGIGIWASDRRFLRLIQE